MPGAAFAKGAVVTNDFACGMLTATGGFFLTTDSHEVQTPSGNATLKCFGDTANNTGKAIVFEHFLCGTSFGLTTDSREVISANGEAVLTCLVH